MVLISRIIRLLFIGKVDGMGLNIGWYLHLIRWRNCLIRIDGNVLVFIVRMMVLVGMCLMAFAIR